MKHSDYEKGEAAALMFLLFDLSFLNHIFYITFFVCTNVFVCIEKKHMYPLNPLDIDYGNF